MTGRGHRQTDRQTDRQRERETEENRKRINSSRKENRERAM